MGEARRHNLLTVGEVAADLNCAAKKVWQLIHDRELQAVNITPRGKRPTYRIDPHDLSEMKRRQQLIPHRQVERRRRIESQEEVINFWK